MIFIDGIHDLMERIEEYKLMFPDSYTSIEKIQEDLKEYEGFSPGHTFGISIAEEWKDKCYGFEVDKVTPKDIIFKYVGIWKC